MYRLLLLVAFVFVGHLSNQLFAQSSTSLNSFEVTHDNLLDMSSNDWSFYIDEEQNIYYIDFEKINVNLNDIQVKDADGEVLLKDDLYDLPVDTIYELDLSTFAKGTYTVELRSFTGLLSKAIELK